MPPIWVLVVISTQRIPYREALFHSSTDSLHQILGGFGLIQKHKLGRDPEAQTLEDALCLVFLEAQFGDLASKLDPATLPGVVLKTWQKMSDPAKALALELRLDPSDRDLLLGLLKQA